MIVLRLADERGVALPLALMALMVLAALSAALLAVGSSELQIAGNHLGRVQAYFLAEAGVEDAFNSFRANPGQLSAASADLTAVPGLAGPGATLAPFGSYTVQYQSAGSNTVLVVSTGTSASGAQSVLRATLSNSFSSDDAIRTGGSLTISGNPAVEGNCGSVHTNQNLTISGDPEVDGDATASGTYAGPSAFGPGGQPLKPIPVINPLDFLAAAKQTLPVNQVFQMKSDGRVLDGADAVIRTLTSGQTFNGWQYTSGTPANWRFSGNSAYDGTYYTEGNVEVSGNPGSEETPWVTTILATGDIELSGNPEMSPHLTDTLLVAGLDIKISGNFKQSSRGLIAAHEQIKISGNPTINGYIIAEKASSISSLVTANSITGNPDITFNCVLNPPVPGPLQMLALGP